MCQKSFTQDSPDQQDNSQRSMSPLTESEIAGLALAEDDVFGPGTQQAMNQQELAVPTPSYRVSDNRTAFPPYAIAGLETKLYHDLRDSQINSQSIFGGYRGAVNASETFVAEENNCCLFLTGFPADITVRKFVEKVQNHQLGKIAAMHINPPSAHHPSAAIKVTMWTRQGAERLRHAIQSQQITFGGHNLRALWNRNHVAPRPVPVQNESRVLLVIGRPEHVSPHVMLP